MKLQIKYGILVLICGLLLMGCNKEEKTKGPLEDKLGIKTWKESFEGDSAQYGKVKIKFDIQKPVVPEEKDMWVAEGTFLENSPKFREKVLGNLYPGCTIYNWDESEWPVDYLEEYITAQERGEVQSQADAEEWLVFQRNEEKCTPDILRSYLATAPENAKLNEDYMSEQYLIQKEGHDYVMTFSDRGIVNTNGSFYVELKNPKGKADWFDDEKFGKYAVSNGIKPMDTGLENRCRYSSDEAKQLTEEFLAAFGMGPLYLSEMIHLKWKMYGDEALDDVLYGYELCYRYVDAETVKSYRVVVSDFGVVHAYLENPFSTCKMVKDVPLLPFDQVQQCIRMELQNPESIVWKNISECMTEDKIEELEFKWNMSLQYIQVKEENSSAWSIIPAWTLDHGVMINAIDGSPIRFVNPWK